MPEVITRHLSTPDEVRTFPKTKIEVLDFGEATVMRMTLEPGWRWSEHVKPVVGTESCETSHFNYGISGRLHVRMNDGTEAEIGPGDVQVVHPGHDAWVVGNEPFVGLDFKGGRTYGKTT